MVKNEIGREALKYNFLKKIIIRFDYDGMDDTELDQVLSDVSLKLKEYGYTNRTTETATEMQIQFDSKGKDHLETSEEVITEWIGQINTDINK